MPILIGVLDCEKAVEMLVQDNATAPEACNSCRRFMLIGSPPRISRHHDALGKALQEPCRPLPPSRSTSSGAHRVPGAPCWGARYVRRTRAVRRGTRMGGARPLNALVGIESGAWPDRPPEEQVLGAHRLGAVVALHGITS